MGLLEEHKKELVWENVLIHWREWMVPVLVAAAVGMTMLLVVLPQVGRIVEARMELKKGQSELEKLAMKRQTLESLSSHEIEEQLRVVDVALATSKPVLPLINGLQKQALEAGVVLAGYDLSPGTVASETAEITATTVRGGEGDELNSFRVEVTVRGNFEAINVFLRRLSQMAPLVSLESFGLSGGQSVFEKEEEITLELRAYYADIKSVPVGEKAGSIAELKADDLKILERLSLLAKPEVSGGDEDSQGIIEKKENLFVF